MDMGKGKPRALAAPAILRLASRGRKKRSLAPLTLAVLVVLEGCGVRATAEETTSRINQAIDELSRNSDDWQATLNRLSADLRNTGSQFADRVEQITQRAIGTIGAEYRCNLDFTLTRVKQQLTSVVDQIAGRQPAPLPPGVCTVEPNVLNMASRPDAVRIYGYDLDRVTSVALRYANGERDISTLRATPTPYLITVNVSPTSDQLICNLPGRRIQLRSGSAVVREIDVIDYQCPGAPPPPPARPERLVPTIGERVLEEAGGVLGLSVDRSYGGRCSPGYHRTQAEARNEATGNVGWCGFVRWENEDPQNCTAIVHFGMRPLQGVRCRLRIWEAGDQQPAPPAPDCNCR
jgi:hypothetical protein